jgi:hypothetical protein
MFSSPALAVVAHSSSSFFSLSQSLMSSHFSPADTVTNQYATSDPYPVLLTNTNITVEVNCLPNLFPANPYANWSIPYFPACPPDTGLKTHLTLEGALSVPPLSLTLALPPFLFRSLSQRRLALRLSVPRRLIHRRRMAAPRRAHASWLCSLPSLHVLPDSLLYPSPL